MAKKTKTTIFDLTDIVKEVCNEYGQEVKADAEKICRQLAPEMVAQLRAVKWKTHRVGYSESWTYGIETNKFGTVKVIVYNPDHWQLTHLLENGHEVVKNGVHIGRVEGKKHIKPVQDWAVKEIIKELESKI